MRLRTTDLGILSIIVFGLTLWLLMQRSRMRPENNWPLIYFSGMVLYVKSWGTFIEPEVIYVAIVFALLIRFEFLSTGLQKFLRRLEAVCLIYILWKTAEYFVVF